MVRSRTPRARASGCSIRNRTDFVVARPPTQEYGARRVAAVPDEKARDAMGACAHERAPFRNPPGLTRCRDWVWRCLDRDVLGGCGVRRDRAPLLDPAGHQ